MQKIKPLYRNIILITSYLFLMSIFFYIGFTSGVRKNTTETIDTAAAISIPSHIPTAEPERYRVILEDGELRLLQEDVVQDRQHRDHQRGERQHRDRQQEERQHRDHRQEEHRPCLREEDRPYRLREEDRPCLRGEDRPAR